MPIELSRGVDLTGQGVPTVTWVYDRSTDSIIWSSPIEEFFGFEEGVRDSPFGLCIPSRLAPNQSPAGVQDIRTPGGARFRRSDRHRRGTAGPDPGPIRLGSPPPISTSARESPARTASPQRGGPGSPSSSTAARAIRCLELPRSATSTPASWSTSPPSSGSSGSSASWSIATGCSPRSPPTVVVHQNGGWSTATGPRARDGRRRGRVRLTEY